MTSDITTSYLPQSETETIGGLFDNWVDPIEAVLRDRAREFLQAMLEAEVDEVLARAMPGARRRRTAILRRRRASPVTVTATEPARCWGRSAK
jgi:hypothetical protein